MIGLRQPPPPSPASPGAPGTSQSAGLAALSAGWSLCTRHAEAVLQVVGCSSVARQLTAPRSRKSNMQSTFGSFHRTGFQEPEANLPIFFLVLFFPLVPFFFFASF